MTNRFAEITSLLREVAGKKSGISSPPQGGGRGGSTSGGVRSLRSRSLQKLREHRSLRGRDKSLTTAATGMAIDDDEDEQETDDFESGERHSLINVPHTQPTTSSVFGHGSSISESSSPFASTSRYIPRPKLRSTRSWTEVTTAASTSASVSAATGGAREEYSELTGTFDYDELKSPHISTDEERDSKDNGTSMTVLSGGSINRAQQSDSRVTSLRQAFSDSCDVAWDPLTESTSHESIHLQPNTQSSQV